DPDELSYPAYLWRWVRERLSTCPIPTIAAVHGTAVAGGFELTLACDLVVLADDAHYGDGHTIWGLVPSGGASQRLSRLVGPRLASWMLFSGDPIAPDQAKTYGLVNEVVPAGQVLATSRAMARKLAERGPAAIAAMKQAMRDGLDAGALSDGLDIEKGLLMSHMSGTEPAVGITAFLGRTNPAFSRETQSNRSPRPPT
ncbi:MAG: enoyl-CoA delta isomerase 1, partial [Actinomycetia bacterium]|nr:enoyl-CoA delta isomerase 1 [Actinomycetes bacterium]